MHCTYVCLCVCRWLTLFFFMYMFKTCHGPAGRSHRLLESAPQHPQFKTESSQPKHLVSSQPAAGVSGLSFLRLCRFPPDGYGRVPELCWCWSINVNDLLIIICKILCCRSPPPTHTHTHTNTQTWTHSRAHLTVQLKRMSNVRCPFAW